jgi:hypothetical protein
VVITSKEFLVGSVFSKLKLSKGLMAGLLIGGTLGSVGVAAATSSPSTTVFYACLNVKAGTMNSINTTAVPKCAKGNINTSWNATGPKGDTGVSGTNGTNGAKGDAGAKGDTGAQGPAPSGSYITNVVVPENVRNGYVWAGYLCPNGETSKDWVVVTSFKNVLTDKGYYVCPF